MLNLPITTGRVLPALQIRPVRSVDQPRLTSPARLLAVLALVWAVVPLDGRLQAAEPAQPESVELVELRLKGALLGGRAQDYQRDALISFVWDGTAARQATIGVKPGWNIIGWSGRIDQINVRREANKLRGTIQAYISSNHVDGGRYRFELEGSIDDGRLAGTFHTRHGEATGSGALSGTVRRIQPTPVLPTDATYVLKLDKALPRGEVLTVYLDCQPGQARQAFSFAPTFSRRPFDIDASQLRVEQGRLHGRIQVGRMVVDRRLRDEMLVLGQYDIDARIADGQVRGNFRGTFRNADAEEAVGGDLWGDLAVRSLPPNPAKVMVKLEDGFAGGAYWQNRVFFNFTLQDGRAGQGNASNNKGVFTARLDRAELDAAGPLVLGTLQATVLQSGPVKTGRYELLLEGKRVGPVVSGIFTTRLEGQTMHHGYFMGQIEPLPPDQAATPPAAP